MVAKDYSKVLKPNRRAECRIIQCRINNMVPKNRSFLISQKAVATCKNKRQVIQLLLGPQV